jgi:hypothetical protein
MWYGCERNVVVHDYYHHGFGGGGRIVDDTAIDASTLVSPML